MRNAQRNAFGFVGHRALKLTVNSGNEVVGPKFKVSSGKGVFGVNRAMLVHRMALIARIAKQKFLPVVANYRDVFVEVDGRHVKKQRRQFWISEQMCVKRPHKRFDVGAITQVALCQPRLQSPRCAGARRHSLHRQRSFAL